MVGPIRKNYELNVQDEDIKSKKVPFYKSRILWCAVLNASFVNFFPGAKHWIADNPELYSEILGAIFVLLRSTTHTALNWKILKKKGTK